MTLLEKANQFPPCVCRFLARKKCGQAPMSSREIAALAGLSKARVDSLSLLSSWKGIPIDTVAAFSKACGVDLLRPAAARKYLKRSKRIHLSNATAKQRQFFQKLLQIKRG